MAFPTEQLANGASVASTVLVINTGSSTFKWSLFGDDSEEPIDSGNEPWAAEDAVARKSQIEARLRELPSGHAVGHRVVHGGSALRESVLIDDEVRRELDSVLMLDPLHMRPALVGIDAATLAFPEAAQFAVFDTAFHRTMSEAAAGYALPAEWTEKWGLRRFGFHGLSVNWSVDWVRARQGSLPARVVVAHLGSGCSVTAVREGRSVDTSMGFTPLEGLMMGTRSGSVDPGLLLHLLSRRGVTPYELEDALSHHSGLLGVSGVSADLREVLAASESGNANAKLAHERFVLSARRGVGSMAGVLGGVDLLIFTGGIGEHQAAVRNDIAAALGEGLVDADLNGSVEEGVISRASAATQVMVVRAREDVVVLREVLKLLSHDN